MIYSCQVGHIRSVLIDHWESKEQQRMWLAWFYDHGVPEDEALNVPMGTVLVADDIARTLTYHRVLRDAAGYLRLNDERTDVLTELVVHRMESPALPFPIGSTHDEP